MYSSGFSGGRSSTATRRDSKCPGSGSNLQTASPVPGEEPRARGVHLERSKSVLSFLCAGATGGNGSHIQEEEQDIWRCFAER